MARDLETLGLDTHPASYANALNYGQVRHLVPESIGALPHDLARCEGFIHTWFKPEVWCCDCL